MRLPEEPDVVPQMNILPMIDVIFAILTFFIVSSLFMTRTEGLPVNLPKAATAKPQEQTKIVITVNNKGELSLNRKPIEVNQIAVQLKPLVAETGQAVVVVNADEKIDHGQVIAVMDQVRQVEGAKLAIATRRP
jgi:biopolymer transport protein ExbD